MKFSENWLRERVTVPGDTAALTHRLTRSGLEVAGTEAIGGALEGVVVARILACDPHPNADRLHVCRVDAGDDELQIVCGAPNARAGLVAPLAKVGARLPGKVTIKTAKLRGVESAGMLCSAKELGVDADASGLLELPDDAAPGTPLAKYLGLPDTAIEIELTPNRGDCLGMLGLADEVAAEFGQRAKPFAAPAVAAAIRAPQAIRLEAPDACPRYLGRVVRGVNVAARTPTWMAARLRAADVKCINAIVDITNYVMLETGQPMHAFDLAQLHGAIVVRHARAGEKLKLLDGSDATLDPGFLVIADDAMALAAAGVMGGFASRVTAATRDILFEAAHFAPAAIMGRARKLGVTTDAAFRFERGVDPEMPRSAMERATALLLEIAGGEPGEVAEAVSPAHLPKRAPVVLRAARIQRVLGGAVDPERVHGILVSLGMRVEGVDGGWRVAAPTRRFDIEREEDLIEEVARIDGYDRIPVTLPAGAPPAPHGTGALRPVAAVAHQLAARGYHEAVCYSFVDPRLLELWHLGGSALPLANPLSADLAAMRTSLLPGLVEALKRNANRQQTRVRLFETGNVFARAEGSAGAREDSVQPVETTMLAVVACGGAHAEQWGESKRAVDVFDLKGDFEALTRLFGVAAAWTFKSTDLPPWMHSGRGASLWAPGAAEPAGVLGVLHPSLRHALDVPETMVLEVRLDALCRRALPRAEALPRFPSIRRDIAVEVDEAVAWGSVEAALRGGIGKALRQLVLFDCFRGEGVPKGRKSFAIGLILQDDSRTLVDSDADRSVASAIALLERGFGAKLRG